MNPVTETIEMLNTKSIDEYKIIEDRYLTLKRYLRLYFERHECISREEVELLIESLDDEPIEETKEKGENNE